MSCSDQLIHNSGGKNISAVWRWGSLVLKSISSSVASEPKVNVQVDYRAIL